MMRLRFNSKVIVFITFLFITSNRLENNVCLGYVNPISSRNKGSIIVHRLFAPKKSDTKWNRKNIFQNSLQQSDIEQDDYTNHMFLNESKDDEVDDTPLLSSNEPTILSCRIGDMTLDMIRSTTNIMSYLSSKQDLKAKTLKESDLSQLPAIDLSTPRKNAQLVEDLLDRLLQERDIHTKWDSIINTETFNIVSKSILKNNCTKLDSSL